MSQRESAYDRVEYAAHAYPETHPDQLESLAKVHGIAAPSVETCRVLDVGCGNGSNLIPMAIGLPGAEFVGVDLAAAAIEKGKAFA